MGLLDGLTTGQWTADPERNKLIQQGLLNFGLNLMASKGSFGTAFGRSGLATQDYMQQAQNADIARKFRQKEMEGMTDIQRIRRDLEERQKKQYAAEDQFRQSIPSPQAAMVSGALSGGGGPTVANAQNLRPVNPQAQMLHQALQAGLITPMDWMRAQEKSGPIKLGVNAGLYDPVTHEPIIAPRDAATKPPSSVQEYEYAKGQGYKGTFQDFQLEQRRAGASNVSVNTGQRGLDNTLKLRGDFRSEPIYKAHQDVESAYNQITQALKLNSPAGDLAGATKIMKILDPGSVVRESELYMAMKANGAWDRIVNYADMTLRGTKLTPNQRRDFQTLADKLYAESGRLYSAKRAEYEGIANRNQLPVTDVVGPPIRPVQTPTSGTVRGSLDNDPLGIR